MHVFIPLVTACVCLRGSYSVARVTRRATKRRMLADNMHHWRTYCRKKRFSRIGFLDRLAQFRRRQLIVPVLITVKCPDSLRTLIHR
jgi:hypothetical protein